MSMKLRDFISAARACKSVSEEASLVARECAAIRTTFKDDRSSYRHRNIAKLIFIDMLGYPVTFGQVECLKLIASNRFFEKRIGYLALPVLLDQQSDLLMLATNTIKNDLISPTQYVASAALSALANTATAEMVEILHPEIFQLVNGLNLLLKKKAIFLIVKAVASIPQFIDQIADHFVTLASERNHGVLLATAQLFEAVIKQRALGKLSAKAEGCLRQGIVRLATVQKELMRCSAALLCGERRGGSAQPSPAYPSGFQPGFGQPGTSQPQSHPSSTSIAGGSGNVSIYGPSTFGVGILGPGGLRLSNEFDFGGIEDPALQAAILRLLRQTLRYGLYDAKIIRDCEEICAMSLIPSVSYRAGAHTIVFESLTLAEALLTLQPIKHEGLKNVGGHVGGAALGRDNEGRMRVEVNSEWCFRASESLGFWSMHFLTHKDPTLRCVGVCFVNDLMVSMAQRGLALRSLIPKQLENAQTFILDEIIPNELDMALQRRVVQLAYRIIECSGTGGDLQDRGEIGERGERGERGDIENVGNAEARALKTITKLLDLLLKTTDPVPIARLESEPSGRDVSFTVHAKVVAPSALPAAQAQSQETQKNLLVAELIQTIQKALDTHSPNPYWKTQSLVRLCSMVGNLIADTPSKARIVHALTNHTKLFNPLVSILANALEENLYQMALVEISIQILTDLVASPQTVLFNSKDCPPPPTDAAAAESVGDCDAAVAPGDKRRSSFAAPGSPKNLFDRFDDESLTAGKEVDVNGTGTGNRKPFSYDLIASSTSPSPSPSFAPALEARNLEGKGRSMVGSKDENARDTEVFEAHIDIQWLLALIERIIEIYGFLRTDDCALVTSKLHNARLRGVCAPIATSPIKTSHAQPQLKMIASSYGRNVLLPKQTATALKGSCLLLVVANGLAKIASRVPEHARRICDLLRRLRATSLDYSISSSLEELLSLLEEERGRKILARRFAIKESLNRQAVNVPEASQLSETSEIRQILRTKNAVPATELSMEGQSINKSAGYVKIKRGASPSRLLTSPLDVSPSRSPLSVSPLAVPTSNASAFFNNDKVERVDATNTLSNGSNSTHSPTPDPKPADESSKGSRPSAEYLAKSNELLADLF